MANATSAIGSERDILRDMTRKPQPKPDNPDQFKRFIDMACEVEVDESPEALDKAFEKVTGRPRRTVSRANPDRSRSQRKPDGGRSR
jgi:hypothetical protein